MPLTLFIIIVCAYGLSAFNGKNAEKQEKFMKLLKILLIVFVINVPILMYSGNESMIGGRFGGIIVTLVVIMVGNDLT